MEPTGIGIWALVGVQVVSVGAWLFKEVFLNKPKEEGTALAQKVSTLQQGHNDLKEDHHELKYEFIRVTTDLMGQVRNLANSVQELNNTLKVGIGISNRNVKR